MKRSHTIKLKIVAASVLGSLQGGIAAAATILVPSEQPTILAGINAAAPGDTVLVAGGIYDECDLFLRGGVTLLGAPDDPASVRIDGMFLSNVFIGENLAAPVTIRGFRVVNGWARIGGYDTFGGGVLIRNSTLAISDCIFDTVSA